MWDLIGILMLIYTIIITPLKLGFDIEDLCPSAIWVWEAVIDWFFVGDLFLNFLTATYYQDPNDGYVLSFHPFIIAREYLKCWFWVDFTSSLPIDFFLSRPEGFGARGAAAEAAFGRLSAEERDEVVAALAAEFKAGERERLSCWNAGRGSVCGVPFPGWEDWVREGRTF